MNFIKNIWVGLRHIGVHHGLSYRQKRRLKFLNSFVLISNVVVLFNLLPFLHSPYFIITLFAGLVVFLTNILVLFLNYKRKSVISCFLYVLILPMIMLMASIATKLPIEGYINVEEYVIPRFNLIICVMFTFLLLDQLCEKWLFYIALFFNYFWLITYDYWHAFFGVGIEKLATESYDRSMINAISLVSMIIVTLIIAVMRNIANRYEKKNLALIKELEASNEEITAQNENITTHNEALHNKEKELLSANRMIEDRNLKLEEVKSQLEKVLAERTGALDNSNLELTKKTEVLENFTETISHNLRGPVAQIKGLMSIRNVSLIHPENQEIMNRMEESIETLLDVIEDLNDILNIDKREIDFVEEINVALLIEQVKNDLREDFRYSDITLYEELAIDHILTVRRFLKIILKNLVSNAIKFRNEKLTPHVTISSSENETHYEISVSDNGLGIDMDRFGNDIFKLYKRFHIHTNGLGTGLHFVKLFTEQLGGEVSITSKVLEGTTVKITIQKP